MCADVVMQKEIVSLSTKKEEGRRGEESTVGNVMSQQHQVTAKPEEAYLENCSFYQSVEHINF